MSIAARVIGVALVVAAVVAREVRSPLIIEPQHATDVFDTGLPSDAPAIELEGARSALLFRART